MIFKYFSQEKYKTYPLHIKEMAFVKISKNMTKQQADACNVVASAFNAKKCDLNRTKPCYYADACTKRDCAFAHSKDELSPKICMYDSRCKNDECLFKHSNQSMDEYCKINGFYSNESNDSNEIIEMTPYFDPFEIMDEINEVNFVIEQERWMEEQQDMQTFVNEVEFFDWVGEMEGENDHEEVVF